MRAFFRAIDDFLRGRGAFASDAPLSGRLLWLLTLLIACGLFYGAVMGTYSGLAPERLHQLLYSGVKVPLLLLATFGLCLPSFFVINTVAGLRDDFREVLRAVVATQSCITVVLAGLAPITAFWYLSCANYRQAVLFNAVMFGIASAAAQVVVRRYYGPLIRRSSRHRQLLWAWFFLYAFVGIQMAWILRPFIGAPNAPVAFFRSEAWGNAYVVLARMIAGLFSPGDALLTALWFAAFVGLVGLFIVVYRAVAPRQRAR